MDADSAIDPGAIISAKIRRPFAVLLRAFDYAEDSQIDRWQFAVEMKELLANDASLVDIRWLILCGYAKHGREITLPGEPDRSFQPLAATSFPRGTCLVLSPEGAEALRAALGVTQGQISRPECNGSPAGVVAVPTAELQPTPEWDEVQRELGYRGTVIKRFRVPAPNQESILSSFQQAAWPAFIDDPLPYVENHDPKQRLQATIKSLNRNHLKALIKFHGNGNGRQIRWAAFEGG